MLTERGGLGRSIRVPRRGDKRALMETVGRNASETLVLHKTTRASDLSTRNRALEEIQEALELPTAPLRIECFDISNLQGTEMVASMVVFEDGLPRKSEYRRFVIRGVDGQNDVAAMHEVITRRFRRLLDERGERPIGTARRVRCWSIRPPGRPASSPTRRAWWWWTAAPRRSPPRPGDRRTRNRRRGRVRPGQAAGGGVAARGEEPVILPRASEGLYLLQRVRDEAHRFAITHHRGRRSESMVESLLDEVPGLGEVRRKTLLKHFGSLKKLRAATDELAPVPGFGPRLAAAIVDALEPARGRGDQHGHG